MEFSPTNPIVRLCLQGSAFSEKDQPEEARKAFQQAWNEAKLDFEKFIAAYFVARSQKESADKLKWFETTLEIALNMNDPAVRSALRPIYTCLAQCNDELGERRQSETFHQLALATEETPTDQGPFFHGTRADLKVGDYLQPGGLSNYQQDLKMNHIYFTALVSGAGLAANLAKGDQKGRVYIVEPTGAFENDPNVTNKKFPGNMTRSYRSVDPLKIVGEVDAWNTMTDDEVKKWKEKIASNKGEIIN